MTDKEQKDYHNFNLILAACVDVEKSNIDMIKKDKIKLIPNNITYKCRRLVNEGYMLGEKKKHGEFNSVMWVYKTINPIYSVDAFIEAVTARKVKQWTTRANKQEIKSVKFDENIIIYLNKYDQLTKNFIQIENAHVKTDEEKQRHSKRMLEIEAKQEQDTAEQTRKHRKSPKIHVGIVNYSGF